MKHENITPAMVRDSNRRFYDAIAASYEKIDGRRSPELEGWIRANLLSVRRKCPGGRLLDLGAGSGIVTRCARGLFKTRVALDISREMLFLNRGSFDLGVASDVDRLPFGPKSFDAVTCFSVLHHLYDFNKLVSEVSRVLKPGGVFYADHDMDKTFSARFRAPLSLCRKIRNVKPGYLKANKAVTPALYDLSEFHGDGIASESLVELFKKENFLVECRFHWFGLTRLTNTIFKTRGFPQGWAPLFSITALKK